MSIPKLFLALLLGWIPVSCSVTVVRESGPGRPPGADPVLLSEIDATLSIPVEGERLRHLERLATREDLGPDEQIYLIEKGTEALHFTPHHTRLILAVIRHPRLAPATREYVARNLEELVTVFDRGKVLAELDRQARQRAATRNAPEDESPATGEPTSL